MKLVRSLAVLVAVALAQTASAQSIELERLQLDPSGAGSLVVGTGIVEPKGSFRISAAGDWEHRPLVQAFGNLYGRRDGADVVENRQTLHLTADYVLFDGFEVYARGNYILNQEGADGLEPRETNGFGMPSFGVRLGALRQGVDGAPMNLAAVAEFRPPWGTAGALGKFSQPAALFKLELGREFGSVVVGGELGILARESIPGVGTEPLGGEAVYGVAVAMRGAIRPELSFRGAVPVDSNGRPGYSELLAGIRASFGPAELYALGGPGFFNAIGTPEWRGVVGLAFGKLGAAAAEEAPAEPARAEEPAPAPAPAPAPVDPCAPGQAHTPDQCPALDDDGDGIANGEDACATEKGIPETKGCPAKDGDNDGVADHLDKCPDQAGAADNEGCPRVVVQPEAKKIELKEQVLFDLGKSTIRPESGALLDEIANVLKEHPEIKRVVVEGHSDSTGSLSLNNRLSAARAAAVVSALVERGVEKARMSAKGFGPSRPIASNDTPEGRDANRRVEITIAQSE